MDVSDTVALVGLAGAIFAATVAIWVDIIRRQQRIKIHHEEAEDFFNSAYFHYQSTTQMLRKWADSKAEKIEDPG